MRDLQGLCAFVTGGSRGIGRSAAEAMVAAGMDVAIVGRDGTRASEVAEALAAAGPGGAIGLAADVRDLGSLEAAVATTRDTYGRVDVLIAAAGVGYFGSIVDMDPRDWHAVVDTNLTGVFHAVKAALDPLIAAEGTVVTIGSLAGANFFAGGSAYNASKFGLTGFSQAIMLDLRHRGVRVATIMPGSVATAFGGRPPGPEDAWKIQPDDIAETILFMLRMHPRTLPSKIEVRPSRPPR